MTARFLASGGFLLVVLHGMAAAQVAPPAQPDKDKQLVTVTYDVSDLLHKPGGRTGFDKVEEVVKVLMNFDPQSWHATKDNGRSLQIANGNRLEEIHTTRAKHGEIKELLEALRRLMDVAVDIKSGLYAIDRTVYEKEIKPRLGIARPGPNPHFGSPMTPALTEQLEKHATLVQSAQVRIANGKEASFFSLRKAFTFVDQPAIADKATDSFGIAYYGVSVQANVVVSADRRRVKMKLTEQLTNLIEIKKVTVNHPVTGKPFTFESPELVESSVSATVDVSDGEPFLLPIHLVPPGAKAKDRMLLLMVWPVIYIEAEEKEKQKPGR